MEGSTKSGYASDRSNHKLLQKFKQISEHNVKRIRNLTLQKLYIHAISFLYKEAALLVIYKRIDSQPHLQTTNLDVECKVLDNNHNKQISKLSNLATDKIAEFFQGGAKCLGAFYKGRLIGYSWCHYKDHYFPFFNYSVEVNDGVYIGPDFVAPEYRGNKLHCYLLTEMLNILYKEGYKNVYSSVLHDNHSSIKGLIRAGFSPQKKVRVIRILKSMVYKNINEVADWNNAEQ